MTVSKTMSRVIKQQRISGRAYLTNAARGASNNCIIGVSRAITTGEGIEALGGCLPALTMIAVFVLGWMEREGWSARWTGRWRGERGRVSLRLWGRCR